MKSNSSRCSRKRVWKSGLREREPDPSPSWLRPGTAGSSRVGRREIWQHSPLPRPSRFGYPLALGGTGDGTSSPFYLPDLAADGPRASEQCT